MTQEEKELYAFILKVGENLKKVFPEVGFSLVIFDHFSEDVISYVSNTEENLTPVFRQMVEYSKEDYSKVRNPTIGNA